LTWQFPCHRFSAKDFKKHSFVSRMLIHQDQTIFGLTEDVALVQLANDS
jgi:hypothetical protein